MKTISKLNYCLVVSLLFSNDKVKGKSIKIVIKPKPKPKIKPKTKIKHCVDTQTQN